MSCESCPNSVPVVSQRVADYVVTHLPPALRHRAAVAALEWLTARHAGLELYVGINGRHYTATEKRAIAHEIAAVAGLPCPFKVGESCLLGGLGPLYRTFYEAHRPPYGWLPTQIARLLDGRTYRELVRRGAIADAKVALVTRNEGLEIQPKGANL